MASTDAAARRLRERKQRILERWTERVREHLDAAKSTDPPELVDSIPAFLDRLAEALDSPDPKNKLEPVETWIGKEHAHNRARKTPYSLEELITEHQLLHDTELEILDDSEPLAPEARDVISHATLLAIRTAASEFARLRSEATEGELRASDTRFRHMVEAVKDYAIFTLDPDGYITSWNLGCIRVKRYTPEEAIGQHFSMLYTDEGRRRDEPMSHLRTAAIEGRFRGEGARWRKGREEFFADVSITPIYEGGKIVGFTKVVQDLSERNLLMQERDLTRTHNEQLRAEAEYRNQFVTALTHDLRSPLASAKIAADLIIEHPEEEQKRIVWASKISSALGRADRMISDLLDANRLRAGEPIHLEFSHCDAKEIAELVVDALPQAQGQQVKVEADADVAGFWSGDGIRRVIENLVGNALKYGEEHRPITIRLRRIEDHVLIQVHNFGTISSTHDLDNLFRQFHRTPTAQKSGKQGWGIGLTLVKGIAEAHGGMVKAESYPKEGTTFTVDLPVNGAAAARP
jgi:PAS domain S-box-containing protein